MVDLDLVDDKWMKVFFYIRKTSSSTVFKKTEPSSKQFVYSLKRISNIYTNQKLQWEKKHLQEMGAQYYNISKQTHALKLIFIGVT